MRTLLSVLALVLSATAAQAGLTFEQPPDPAGGVLLSSWYPPDGTDYDQFAYDSFLLSATQPITEVRWRGGYQYTGYGLVQDFSLTFYESTAGDTQPRCGIPGEGDIFLAEYFVGGTAQQTYAGVFGGITMYDYRYVLPQPFQAAGGVKYWLRITGETAGLPFWGVARGTGGNGSHFRFIRGTHQFSFGSGDAAFALYTADGPVCHIATSAAPPGSGTTSGDGAYSPGTLATVVATANPGWGFVNWTEGGAEVSRSPDYSFTVTVDRDLIAHFIPAYTIATTAQPPLGGTTTGDGVYNLGELVTVEAVANPGWVFVNWAEWGVPVSGSPLYSFVASADRALTANFALGPGVVLFDFDNAPPHTSLPIDLTVDGLTAHLSATGGGFSVQRADAMGFTPAGFSGWCIYPNSVFPADLLVSFSSPLTGFSLLFSPQELGCDDSATMRVTAYLGNAYVGTATAVAFPPGTWPTGTLSIASPTQAFDSVAVHYDSRPPTCQDWGPIFLADNMLVTRDLAASVGGTPGKNGLSAVIVPNPFVAEAALRFSTPPAGPVTVTVHDARGRLVRTLTRGEILAAGGGSLSWDGRDERGRAVECGVYFWRATAEGCAMTGRVVRLPSP